MLDYTIFQKYDVHLVVEDIVLGWAHVDEGKNNTKENESSKENPVYGLLSAPLTPGDGTKMIE